MSKEEQTKLTGNERYRSFLKRYFESRKTVADPIFPNGDVITGDPDGNAINHGPADDYTARPTGLLEGGE